RQPKQVLKVPKLPKDLSVRTDDFTFSRYTPAGRALFTVHSKTNLGFIDNRNILEDVDVTIYGDKDTDPVRTVTSKECNYDQKTDYILCKGHVTIQLAPQTQALTEEMIYNHNDRTITVNKPVQFERPGVMSGSAQKLDYSMDSGLLKLNGDVKG